MPRNVYTDPLEAFTYETMLEGLTGIGTETGRLEVKQERIPHGKLAHIACSFANADGGIIGIGLEDPDSPGGLKVHGQTEISDRTKAALVSAINARCYPPVPLDVHGYANADGSMSFLILRVARSTTAPHEYTGSEESVNLPVRRGSITDRLRLAEIDALRTRATEDATARASPLGEREFSQVYLGSEGVDPEFIFGAQLQPVYFRQTRRIMDANDDALCKKAADRTMGPNHCMHSPLTLTTQTDGVWLHTAEYNEQGPGNRIPRPDEQIEILSDGTITARFKQKETDLLHQFLAVLATGYVAAQELFYAFGIHPAAHVYVVARLNASAHETKPAFAQHFEDRFTIDLASEPFADAFHATTMLLYRASSRNSEREAVKQYLQDFVTSFVRVADDLQRRWLS